MSGVMLFHDAPVEDFTLPLSEEHSSEIRSFSCGCVSLFAKNYIWREERFPE
jgi:hypothetical protein